MNDATLQHYQELFELAPNGYLTTDLEGVIAEANRAAEELFGRRRDELAGTSLRTYVAKPARAAFEARLRALAEGRAGRIQDWQLSLRGAGEESIDAEVTVEVLSGAAAGVTSSLLWLIREVTERKRAEEALRDSQQRLKKTQDELREALARSQAVLDSAVDGIVTISESGRVESINPSAEIMFGYSAGEVIGRNVKTLMPLPFSDEHDDYLRRYLETGDKRIIGIGREVVGRRKDGTCFPLDLAVSEFFHCERRSFVGTVRNITERKEMEEALRRERDLAESLVETAPAIVLVLDNDGCIVRFNRYMEELSGYALEEVRGESWFSRFLPQRDRPRVREVFENVLGGISSRESNAIVMKNGEEREIEWHDTILLDANGETRGVLAVGQDMTERLRLEAQFRQAQKMEAVGRLAGGVAHDFNTLLGSIIGYSEVLLDNVPDEGVLRHAAHQIHRGAERGALLTRQLLAFSRRQLLQPRILDLDAVVADMEDMLQRLIGEDVELVHRRSGDVAHVEVDAGQIEQAIMNLVVNARDAMPRGGRIVLVTGNAELDEPAAAELGAPRPGAYVTLEVSDTGMGMDEETLRLLFEPFFTTKGPGKGTGLGLSTVYGIVAQSGGSIGVESELGRGTSFRIYLPRAEAEPALTRPEADLPKPSPRGGNETILLVEDDDMFRGLLGEVLEANGYTVVQASEPAEALQASERLKAPVDLVVSDMVMPGMTGQEMARQLVERHAAAKVLLMSGYTDEELEDRGASGRGTPFLQKPFSTKDFLRLVRKVLGP